MWAPERGNSHARALRQEPGPGVRQRHTVAAGRPIPFKTHDQAIAGSPIRLTEASACCSFATGLSRASWR
jgi:hypothetical protein